MRKSVRRLLVVGLLLSVALPLVIVLSADDETGQRPHTLVIMYVRTWRFFTGD